MFSQGTHYAYTAYGEADDGTQCGDEHDIGIAVEKIGEDGANGESQPQHVQPQGRVDSLVEILSQPKLQEDRGQSDRSNDNQRQRTQECATPGVKNYEGERKQKESGGDKAPAARLGL